MARKESITAQKILNTAFQMTREEGLENVTARKLAAKAGCSTQPIFRVYKNMNELRGAVFDSAVSFFQNFLHLQKKVSEVPFVNLGMSFIKFAVSEKELFLLLFINIGNIDREMYEILNGPDGNVTAEISRAKSIGCRKPMEAFTKMWIFAHGVACMCLSGDYDLKGEETVLLLEEAFGAFSK